MIKKGLGFAALCFVMGFTPVYGREGTAQANAVLMNAQGERVGSATFSAVPDGVQVSVEVEGLTAGPHGFHIHEAGLCEPPDFKTAGAHFNPHEKKHGLQNPEGAHLGDLPNLLVGDDGKGKGKALIQGASFGDGPNSLLQFGGTSVVIHAAADDEMTDPAGNAGARVVCGVIVSESE